MREFGKYLKSWRRHLGLTQGEVGEKIGLSAPSICEIENGSRKNPLSPEEIVKISQAMLNTSLAQHYCTTCPVRSVISIRKIPPLNNIVAGPLAAAVKNVQKLSEAAEFLQRLVPRLLTKGFEQSPDFIEVRNDVVIKATDVRRGLEILFVQMIDAGLLTDQELKMLEDMQQQLCEAKGHHIPEAAE